MIDPNSIFKKGYYRTEAPTDGFTDEQRRMAQKLLRGDNLDRLNNASRTGRRFRPVPVSIRYEYWWFNGASCWGGGWLMARVENGRRSDHHFTGEIEDEINRLKAAGFTVKEVPIEGAPTLLNATRGTSHRKSFSERFGSFGGRK